MVTKKLIKSYDFETIEDYFNYILESEINGQRSQVISLIKLLSNIQKANFLNWIDLTNGGFNFKKIEVEQIKKLVFNSF